MNSLKYIAGISIILCLSGCTGMNAKFDCTKVDGAGMGCTSMQSVNKQADEGVFASEDPSFNKENTKTKNQKVVLPQGLALNAPKPGDPVRFAESIQQIWIAPYQDKNGNYHEPSLIYTVVYPSHWVGIPAKIIRDDEE